jgi:hypothetical protein
MTRRLLNLLTLPSLLLCVATVDSAMGVSTTPRRRINGGRARLASLRRRRHRSPNDLSLAPKAWVHELARRVGHAGRRADDLFTAHRSVLVQFGFSELFASAGGSLPRGTVRSDRPPFGNLRSQLPQLAH